VNTLIGLRVEREHVFEETHALVLDWLRRGVLDGVRVDHPDGLRDPLEYFAAARACAGCVDRRREDSGAGRVSARELADRRAPADTTS
jgi:maltooligosyltrehalose synthase